MTTSDAKAKCGAKTRRGTACTRPAGWGTDHAHYGSCKLHSGSTPNGSKAAGKEMVKAELRFMGSQLDVDAEPTEAMLSCVRLAARHVAYFTRMVEQVEPGEELGDGLLHPWGRLQTEAIDRLARVSKAALDAGVAERRVRIAENVGARIAQALEETLAALDMPAAQRGRLAHEFGTKLRLLEVTTGDGDMEQSA